MKIEAGTAGNFDLGVYRFRPVIELVDALIQFLVDKSRSEELVGTMLAVRLVGEADGHPIRRGIENDATISNQSYRVIPDGVGTSMTDIKDPSFDFNANATLNLENGQTFTENVKLAFLRAYIVKEQIVTILPSNKELERRILVGAKANSAKGKEYRKVSMALKLIGFYKEVPPMYEEDNQRIGELKAAKSFFEENGYPTSTKTYTSCPCIESEKK